MNFLSSQPAGGNVAVIIVVCVIAALLIGWMIWQSIRNKKQQKEAQARVEALKPGDKIKTIGGSQQIAQPDFSIICRGLWS